MSVLELNLDNFNSEVLESDKPVLVDFYATWCGPCKIMSPVVDEIAEENADVKVCKLDVDEASYIAEQYGVQSIPTLLVFKNGDVSKGFVGVTPKESLVDALK